MVNLSYILFERSTCLRETTHNFTFSSYLNENTKTFLTTYLKRFKSQETQLNYCLAINEFTEFIKKDLCAATSNDCKQYVLHLESKRNAHQIKTATLAKKRFQISSVFSAMCESHSREHLSLPTGFENYFMDIHTDTVPTSFRYEKVPSIEQMDILYRYLITNDPMTCVAFLLAFKGFLTTGEFLNLSVSDFFEDANDRMIVRIVNPSFPLEIRYNSIPNDVKEILLSYFATLPANTSKLFAKKDGTIYTARTLAMRLKNACEVCGIPHYTYNDFRNAGGIFAVSYHADVAVVANSFGYRTNKHINRLDSLKVTVNDAADYLGISFKETPK